MDALYQAIGPWRQPLAIGLLFAMLVWESAAPFFGFFRGTARDRVRHGGINILLGVINAVVVAAVFVKLWTWVATWTEAQGFGLLHLVELPWWLSVIGALLLLDFWTYWWHRFNHVIPFLWRFHRVHHSDPRMDVTTANRFHIGEMVISSILRLPVLLITGVSLGELALYEVLLLANTQLHHANIGLSGKSDQLLRIFLTSPAMHKVHHSRWMPETNSNYTSLLSVWDRLFRSFRLREDPHEIAFGLDDTDDPKQQTIGGLMVMPAEKRKDRRTQ